LHMRKKIATSDSNRDSPEFFYLLPRDQD
jgi:hypothetical protein